ncbi:MAG: tubulin-like doman-containing protein, partial [Myxococcota bacterium]
MSQITKNLLIGLGGTGQNVLLEVKRSFLTSPEGKIPEELVFLAIDTDKPFEKTDPYSDRSVGFEPNEFLRLPGQGSVAVAQASEREGTWWPPGVTDWPLPGAGAAAKRMHGRAKLGLSIRNVASKIQSAVAACKGAGRNRPDVHGQGEIRVTIVCSMAGGTGAGCWLDVANLVHEHVNIERGDKVWGIMLLGDAFDGLKGTRNKYANTVACLRELQWLMENILGDKDKEKRYELNERKMNFPDAKIFNHCFLVTRSTGYGEVIEDRDAL